MIFKKVVQKKYHNYCQDNHNFLFKSSINKPLCSVEHKLLKSLCSVYFKSCIKQLHCYRSMKLMSTSTINQCSKNISYALCSICLNDTRFSLYVQDILKLDSMVKNVTIVCFRIIANIKHKKTHRSPIRQININIIRYPF